MESNHRHRERERLVVKLAYGDPRTGKSLEGIEKQADARLYALIRVQHDAIAEIVNKADRQSKLQLAASRLGDKAALQTGTNGVQLGFRNSPLEPQQ